MLFALMFSGYASFDYAHDGFRKTSLVKLCISLNDKIVDELSLICPESVVVKKAKFLVHKLKDVGSRLLLYSVLFFLQVVPQQQYPVKIKATIGEKSTKAICQTEIKPLKKDFTGTMKGSQPVLDFRSHFFLFQGILAEQWTGSERSYRTRQREKKE